MKNKKAEGVFGMSFGMIFTIILIVFFIATAFIALKAFLNWQKTVQVGIFFEDLQTEINTAWNAESYGPNYFNRTLPSGVKAVCFVNLSIPTSNANNLETQIYKYMKQGYVDLKKNTYLYSPNNDYGINWKTLNHLDFSGRNPRCIQVINGDISIKIERKFEDKYPRILS